MSERTFGSGHFGEWFTDAFGLPAYRYTCDQRTDPKAVSPVNPIWRSPTDHLHQVGNDRITAVASNYGYLQVRQDEGGPKFLNDYDPRDGHFAGGFGYLTDGQTSLSTFYGGDAGAFHRVFGIGYLRKTVVGGGYTADQVIFAPFGDDPLLISQVTVTNQRDTAVDLRWVEYWGCQILQFSHRSQVISVVSRGKKRVPDLRRAFSRRFSQGFSPVEGRTGLLNTKRFLGYTAGDRATWGLDQLILATIAKKTTGGALKAPVKEAWLEDTSPPPTFLVSLDAPADGVSCDEAAFFGHGGPEHPDGLQASLPSDLPPKASGSAMLLERRLRLDAGQSKTLYFAYGYLPEGLELSPLLAKYRQDLPGLWARSSAAWRSDRISLTVPDEPWVDRELTWHNYYLRSNLTYDTFFREHILSQGHVYQYIIGFQGAARDPLQHALPFTFSRPGIVKEILRYTLKEVLPDGEIPYGITGHGMHMAVPFRPSDAELWLLWLAGEYVLSTRDIAFLDETVPTYPVYGAKAGRETVRNLLARCYRHLAKVTGTAKHGLLRLSNGDWNDGAVVGFVPKEQHEIVRQQGESVLNAAFAAYALDVYSGMLAFVGDQALAAETRALAEEQRQAVRRQWAGRWFRRGWLSESLGWIGEDVMWLEPQPWAIIGGAATAEQRAALVTSLNELARGPSPIGAMLMSKTLPQIASAPGMLTNAAVWPSINGTLVWALARVDGELAWDEWQKNTLARHAEAYPDVWYGIWSGPDTYNSVFSTYPGQTFFDEKVLKGETPESPLGSGTNWTDLPVMNMHPHAWPLYDVPKLAGVRFTAQGLDLCPCLPQAAYRFDSPLVGLEKAAAGYGGWYAPAAAGRWQITLHLPEEDARRLDRLEVNGQAQAVQRQPDGALTWSGESSAGQPLRWSLTADLPTAPAQSTGAVKGTAAPSPAPAGAPAVVTARHEEMSGRERILAALRGQPVDRLPFVPLIDTYSVLDMPAQVQAALQAASSEGYWQGILAASRELGCDIMLRHVYVTKSPSGAPHLNGFGRFLPPVLASSRMDGSLLEETLETPLGRLSATWGFTDRHGWIPHPIKHLVNNHQELQVFAYAVEHLSEEPPEPDYGNLLAAERALGDAGIATTSFLNTPLMELIEGCWGLEGTYYLLQDCPREVEAILDKLQRVQRLVVERIAASPAAVVIEYENTSSTLLSPKVFRRYCLPHLNKYARTLRAAGKVFLVHMCGKLGAFADDLAAGEFSGLADISPQPTGDLTLDEAAARLTPSGKVLVGGIDATTFIGADMGELEAKIVRLIRRVKPYPGVLLGSADTVPRGTPLESLRLLQHLVSTVGSYRDGGPAGYRPGAFAATLAAPAAAAPELEAASPGAEASPEPAPAAAASEPGALAMLQVMQELTRRLDGKRPDVSGTIKFDITDDTVYRLFIDAGKCRLEVADGPADASMTGPSRHLLALFAGKLNATSAFMTRKIKFDGNLQLMGMLQSAK